MPDEVKLEPCPNPSCTSKFDPICYHAVGLRQVRCRCGASGPFKHSEQDAIVAWNALPRKPKWTTYDGTEETLPPLEDIVCVKLANLSTVAWRRDFSGVSFWMFQDGRRQMIVSGDRWMPWPEEGE